MKKKCFFVITLMVVSALLLTACGGAADETLPVSDSAYEDYVGEQFSGKDPWGGNLAITVRSVVDGKMDWTFTDFFDDHTLYQEQSATPVQDGAAEYRIEGKDAEHENVRFSYQGTMKLKDGQITFRFLTGSVMTDSAEGGSSDRVAEALKDSGLQNEVVLQKTADESLMIYTVQEGDSIHSIAKEFGLTTKELAIINQTVIIETAKAHGYEFDDVIEYAKYLFPGEELKVPKTSDANDVLLGDEQFEAYIPLLEGKRIALFSNHTGIVGDETSAASAPDADTHFGLDDTGKEITYGQHILDALIERDVNVTAIFSPEHGFRGNEDAGATVDDSVDEKTGVPILSLYKDDNVKEPAEEDMAKFDLLLVDMQDVGLRYYTYYISMYYLMDACTKDGKEVLILDRPNPNGFYVDGPMIQDEYKSDVGRLPIPVVYGMTWGELAQMINGEGWLTAGKDTCKLTVIPCRNYTHSMKTSLIRNPSPNLKDMRAVYLYSSTCFFENTQVSVGRGTEFPFEALGSPYLKDDPAYDFSFTPESMAGALEPPFLGETCYGIDLRNVPLEKIWAEGVNPEYLVQMYQAYKKTGMKDSFWGTPLENGQYWIDRLSGSDELRKMIEEGKTAEEIKATWQDDIRKFKKQRRPYLLYEE